MNRYTLPSGATYATMSDGKLSITFAAPAGISSQGTPESAGRGTGVDQTMGARASSRSRVPSEEDDGRTRTRKSRKGEKSSSPRGSPSDPRSANQQLEWFTKSPKEGGSTDERSC